MQVSFSCWTSGTKSNASACVNAAVYLPTVTVFATETPRVDSTSGFTTTRLGVCSMEAGAVLHPVDERGWVWLFQPWASACWCYRWVGAPQRPGMAQQLYLALCSSGISLATRRDLAHTIVGDIMRHHGGLWNRITQPKSLFALGKTDAPGHVAATSYCCPGTLCNAKLSLFYVILSQSYLSIFG